MRGSKMMQMIRTVRMMRMNGVMRNGTMGMMGRVWGVVCLIWWGSASVVLAQKAKASGAAYEQRMKKGQALYKAEKWQESLDMFQSALKALRGRPLYQKSEAYVYIGMALFRLQKAGMALKSFEVALYQDMCLEVPATESEELRSLFSEARERVSRRGGLVGKGDGCGRSSAPPSSGGAGVPVSISPWPWVALGVGALLLTGGAVLLTNSLVHQGQAENWQQSTAGKGYKQEDLDATSQPLKDTAGWQMPTGIGLLVVGVLAVGASVPLFLFLKGSPSKGATAAMPMAGREDGVRVRLLSVD